MSTKEYEVVEEVKNTTKITEVYCDKCGKFIVSYDGENRPKSNFVNWYGDWHIYFNGIDVFATLCEDCKNEVEESLGANFLESIAKLDIPAHIFMGIMKCHFQCVDGKIMPYRKD